MPCSTAEKKAYNAKYYALHKEQENARCKARRKAHPEREKAYKKARYAMCSEQEKASAKYRYAAHPERGKANARAWAASHREQKRASGKAWTEAHKEQENTRKKAWRSAHRKQENARCKAWDATHPELKKARTKAWAESHPEQRKIYKHNRRNRTEIDGGALSSGIIAVLFTRQKGKCAICKKSLKAGHHLDHIVPVARGGKNSDRNVQLTCPKCNLEKNSKDPIQFMQERGYLL